MKRTALLYSRSHAAGRRGFTIVELLVVIVVIAILAAITVVAYGNIKQRADNNAIMDAASKSLRMIQAYTADTGSVPATGSACVTVDSGCATGASYTPNATFNTNMAKIGSVPRSVPVSDSNRYGIIYYYNASRTVGGQPTPIALLYWLQGTNQKCGLSNILADPNSTTTTLSTTGYTTGNDASTGKTLCATSLPGVN